MPRTWFVTGASSGLGRSMAEAALGAGDRVAGTARDAARLRELTDRHGDAFVPIALEVTDPEQVRTALDEVFDRFGRLDVLVNNAGRTQVGTVEETPHDVTRELFELNFFAPLDVLHAALPRLRAQGSGHILNVSSQSGHWGLMGNGIYSATKFALEGMSEALRQELEPLGITVTIVEPGLLGTDLTSSMHRSEPMAAYAAVHRFLGSSEAAMSEPINDVARAGQVVLQVVNAEHPPQRVCLGSDVFDNIARKLREELEEYAVWEQVSRSVDIRRSTNP